MRQSKHSKTLNTIQQRIPREYWVWRGVRISAVVLALLIFLQLATAVGQGTTMEFDRYVLLSVHTTASGLQDAVWWMVTQFGGVAAAVVAIGAVVAVLYRKEHISRAVQFAVGVGGAMVLSTVLKLLFERVRPDLWQQIIFEASYSFPNGHAIASSAIAFSLIAVLWHTKWRTVSIVGGVIYMMLIGYSRLYLGVHYPTDIMAGWLVALMWIIFVSLVFDSWHQMRASRD